MAPSPVSVLERTPVVAVDGSAGPSRPDLGVGARLRVVRTAKGMTARELAVRGGVTPAYLSRLETGRLSPTVSTLSKVMQALGESVAVLFEEPAGPPGPLVRRGQRPVIRSHGVADELLSPTRSGRLEVLETVVAAGASSGTQPYSHAGDEECIVMLEGQLDVCVQDVTYELWPGDALTFACPVAHSWSNPSSVPSRALWIITPAGY